VDVGIDVPQHVIVRKAGGKNCSEDGRILLI
jgi:hypothetical protein